MPAHVSAQRVDKKGRGIPLFFVRPGPSIGRDVVNSPTHQRSRDYFARSPAGTQLSCCECRLHRFDPSHRSSTGYLTLVLDCPLFNSQCRPVECSRDTERSPEGTGRSPLKTNSFETCQVSTGASCPCRFGSRPCTAVGLDICHHNPHG